MIILTSSDDLRMDLQDVAGSAMSLRFVASYTDFNATTGATVGAGREVTSRTTAGPATHTILTAPAVGNIRVVSAFSCQCVANVALFQLSQGASTALYQGFLEPGDELDFTAELGFKFSRSATVRDFRREMLSDYQVSVTPTGTRQFNLGPLWVPVVAGVPYIIHGKILASSGGFAISPILELTSASSYLAAAFGSIDSSVTGSAMYSDTVTTNDTPIVQTTTGGQYAMTVFTANITPVSDGVISTKIQIVGTGIPTIHKQSHIHARGF